MSVPITDIAQVNAAIYQLLLNVTELATLVGVHPETGVPQIYFNSAPLKATYPMCIFRYMGGGYKRGGGAKKIFTKMTYNIQIVTDDTSLASILPAYTAMEPVLQHDQTVTDTVFIGMHLDSPISHSQNDNGIVVQFLGYQVNLMAYNNATKFLAPAG